MKLFFKIMFAIYVPLGILILIINPLFGLAIIIIGIIGFINTDKIVEKLKQKKSGSSAYPSIAENAAVQKSPPEMTAPAKEAASSKVKETQEVFKVAGVTYYTDAIMSLAEDNPFYDYSKRDLIDECLTDERIYEYTFSPKEVELVDEPDNEADPKAIKVIIDGVHVGYIKKGSTGRIRNLRKHGRIERIEADIYGGKYKIVFSDVDDDGKERYEYDKDESPFGVKLTLYLYPEEE